MSPGQLLAWLESQTTEKVYTANYKMIAQLEGCIGTIEGLTLEKGILAFKGVPIVWWPSKEGEEPVTVSCHNQSQ